MRAARLGSAARTLDRRRTDIPRTGEDRGEQHERDRPTARPAPTPVADVEEALRDVIDPELGINVVDLGLVYGVIIDQTNNASST